MLRAHKGGPRGPPILTPHPSSPLNWRSGWAKGPVLRLLPAVEAALPPPVHPFPPAADSAQMPARPTWA